MRSRKDEEKTVRTRTKKRRVGSGELSLQPEDVGELWTLCCQDLEPEELVILRNKRFSSYSSI